jgi:hypothetical protein
MWKFLPLQEREILAFAALDSAAMSHLGPARAMSLSMPPDVPPRQEREDTDSHYLKVVDTGLPARNAASDAGEIVSAAVQSFDDSNKERERRQARSRERRKMVPLTQALALRYEIRRIWDQFKRRYFLNQTFAGIVISHPLKLHILVAADLTARKRP